MTKNEFVKKIVEKTDGCTAKCVNDALDAIASTIVTECRDNGEKITIPGLGTFKQKINKARTGTNPLTGKPLSVPQTSTIAFKPAGTVKQ